MYDVENPTKASTAVANPDGSVYKTHQLASDEWNIVRESLYVLTYSKVAVDLLQETLRVTPNRVLPVIGRLAYTLHQDTQLKYEKRTVGIYSEAVREARELVYKDLCRRFFNELQVCKLEDFAVATLLDPRQKNFKFKYVNKWMQGSFALS